MMVTRKEAEAIIEGKGAEMPRQIRNILFSSGKISPQDSYKGRD